MAAARRGRGRAWAWAWALGLVLGLGRAQRVPLLAWSTDSSLWPPQPHGTEGSLVTPEQLQALLTPPLLRGPRTLLLVLQDKLSLEDFTAFGGVYGNKADSAFPNLQGALEAAGSRLVLPAVAGGAVGALPHSLPHTWGAAPLRVDGASLRQLRLNQSLPSLLLLRLPHGSSLMTPREVLTSNDEQLGQVLSVLREEGLPHSVLFTALRPSRVLRSAPPPSPLGSGRSLLGRKENVGGAEDEEDDGETPPPLRWPPQGPPQILFWARNVSVTFRGEQKDLTSRTFGGGARVNLGGSSWDPQEARLVLSYDDVFGGTLNITLIFRQGWFQISGRSWFWLSELGVDLGGSEVSPPPKAGRVLGGVGGVGGATAPTPLGWRCGEMRLQTNPPGGGERWEVLMREVQVQAFNVSGGFGGASDCASFFSPGAWMGLVTGGGLLGGLLWGGGLLLRLRTMDRFDDPRGPPLGVPLGE